MKKGFTLVEILVVLVIIGILVALILPNALSAIDQGNVKSAAATLRNIDTAIKICYSEEAAWAPCSTIVDLEPGGTTVAGFMEPLPAGGLDPWGGVYAVEPVVDPATGALIGEQSTKAAIFPAWPALLPVDRV